MDIVLEILALLVLIGLAVVNLGGGIAALLFGRRLPWVWFALAVYESTQRLLSVALYREFDVVRGLGSLGGRYWPPCWPSSSNAVSEGWC